MNYVITHPEMMAHAMDLFNVSEVPGAENNPQIMKMFAAIDQDWVQGDETSWCSAFINYLAKENGYDYSGSLTARSWLPIGRRASIPNPGDIAVLWRESPDSWKGHVGFFIRDDGMNVWILGGNQSNKVCIKPYPRERVINYLAKENGYEYSGSLTARSWLPIGRRASIPNPGDIAVLWRESPESWKGHVGFFIRDDGTNVWILGGNQSNKVCIKAYPRERVINYRILNKI